MAKSVDSMVPERLCLIPGTPEQIQGEMQAMRTSLNGKIEALSGKVLAKATVVMALARYFGAMNERAEHIEAHLGIAT